MKVSYVIIFTLICNSLCRVVVFPFDMSFLYKCGRGDLYSFTADGLKISKWAKSNKESRLYYKNQWLDDQIVIDNKYKARIAADGVKEKKIGKITIGTEVIPYRAISFVLQGSIYSMNQNGKSALLDPEVRSCPDFVLIGLELTRRGKYSPFGAFEYELPLTESEGKSEVLLISQKTITYQTKRTDGVVSNRSSQLISSLVEFNVEVLNNYFPRKEVTKIIEDERPDEEFEFTATIGRRLRLTLNGKFSPRLLIFLKKVQEVVNKRKQVPGRVTKLRKLKKLRN
jgi:hypothetical protein